MDETTASELKQKLDNGESIQFYNPTNDFPQMLTTYLILPKKTHWKFCLLTAYQ